MIKKVGVIGAGTMGSGITQVFAQSGFSVVLIDLAPALSARARVGARIALSGILDSQAAEVRAAYAATFDIETDEREEGWALVRGVRR